MPALCYRKRPIEVEAIQCHLYDDESVEAVEQFVGEENIGFYDDGLANAGVGGTAEGGPHGQIYDRLHSTWIRFESGDWIIKDIQGEFYPIKDSIFRETYEPADGAA